MRRLAIALLACGALASIALCALYGWDQATETKDRVTQGFIFGFVAAATLFLHGLALRMWVSGWRKSGAFVGVVAMLAFMMTAFTSLGGLASRSDKVVAERQEAIDNRADTKGQIDALVVEKGGLKYAWTTKAGVEAAQRLADTAKANREAECAKRGDNCRNREADERKALEALALAQTNKATTDRVIEIDAELKRLRSLRGDGTVGSANPLEVLLTRIFGAWGAMLSAWQKALFAVIYDLVLVALMIGIEATGTVKAEPKRARDDRVEADVSTKPEILDISPEPVAPVVIPKPQPPKLIASSPSPVGSVNRILTDNLESATGQKVELADIARRYREVCKAQDRKPVSQDEFIEGVERFCKTIGLKRRTIDGHLYLMDVQLSQNKTVMAVDKST